MGIGMLHLIFWDPNSALNLSPDRALDLYGDPHTALVLDLRLDTALDLEGDRDAALDLYGTPDTALDLLGIQRLI